jgi:two-component system KDP operon response regulator KdpE
LIENQGRVLTFNQILHEIWGSGYGDSMAYVHVYISRLRKKLEEDPKSPRYFVNEHQVGYRFVG